MVGMQSSEKVLNHYSFNADMVFYKVLKSDRTNLPNQNKNSTS